MTRRKKTSTDDPAQQLRAFGLTYPGAHLKSPWPDHLDLAVNDKTFAYLSVDGQPFSISCKLPRSSEAARMLPFTTPTGYGLGKSGWVTATPAEDDDPPLELFKAWIDESYRAQAPKRLIAELDARASAGTTASPSKPKATKKTKTAKKTTSKTKAKKKAARAKRG